MNEEQQLLLITILARIDALYAPFRWSRDAMAPATAISERRTAYRASGLQITGGGGTADRKSFERRIGELAAQKMITISRGRAKRSGVRLTDFGDDYASEIVSAGTVRTSWKWLRKVAKLTDQGKTNAGFVREDDLAGVPYCGLLLPEAITDLAVDALPLLRRGLLQSSSDTCQLIGYAITEKGREALKAGKPKPLRNAPRPVKALANAFFDEYFSALDERNSWAPLPSHVWIPLGAGSWK